MLFVCIHTWRSNIHMCDYTCKCVCVPLYLHDFILFLSLLKDNSAYVASLLKISPNYSHIRVLIMQSSHLRHVWHKTVFLAYSSPTHFSHSVVCLNNFFWPSIITIRRLKPSSFNLTFWFIRIESFERFRSRAFSKWQVCDEAAFLDYCFLKHSLCKIVDVMCIRLFSVGTFFYSQLALRTF